MILKLKFVDTSPNKNPLADVKAAIYLDDALLVVAVSGEDGLAVVDVDPSVYKVIVSCPTRMGYKVENPYEVKLVESGSTFEIPIELFQYPTAQKAGYCRCSGFLEYGSGIPASGVSLWFSPVRVPDMRYGAWVLNDQFFVESDKDGFVTVDLIRGALYNVRFSGLRSLSWEFFVPNREWAVLPDVLFPVVDSVSFSPAGPLELSVGESKTLSVVVAFKSGLELRGADLGKNWPVRFVASDVDVLAVSENEDGTIVATGKSPGTSSVTAVASAVADPVRVLPEPGGIGGELTVVVS